MRAFNVAAAIVAVASCVAVVVACSGSDGAAGNGGAPGTQGTTGTVGTVGPTGPNGPNGPSGEAGAPGGTVIITERAKHGLDVSPVVLNLAGLTGDQVEQIGQGSYLVNAVGGCGDCHNSTDATPKFLAGGKAFGTVFARNLTPDTATGLKLSEADFITAMRTGADFAGVAAAGTPTKTLNVMPWANYRWMSTPDLRAIYAYLRVIPAVNNAVMTDSKTAVAPGTFPATYTDGNTAPARALPPELDATNKPIPDPDYVLRGAAIVPLDFAPAFNDAQTEGLYGRGSYLVNSAAGCGGCHSNPEKTSGKINPAMYLAGGRVFAVPTALRATLKQTRVMSANLAGGGGFFANAGFSAFLTTITQGVHGDDPAPQPKLGYPMPWDRYRLMTLEDLTAVYTYLSIVAKNAGVPGKAVQAYARYCAVDNDCNTGAGETCNVATNECIGKGCGADSDCDACQTCDLGNTNACLAPATNAACLTSGL